MIYKYEVRNYRGRDVLYLYLTMDSEFAEELGNQQEEALEDRCKRYIKNKKIDYQGEDVFLVVDGIVVKSLSIKDQDIHIEVLDDKCSYVNSKYRVKIRNHQEEKELALKDYLIGVLFTNSTYTMPVEVIKALCVLYRTYTFYKMEKDGFLDVEDSFIKYKSISYYKLFYLEQYDDIYEKIENAVRETDCIFMTYQNQYIMPYIHHTNNGFTEEKEGIPYLEKKYSLWDLLSPMYMEIKEFSYERLEKLLNVTREELENIRILELTSGNKIQKLKIGPIVYTGEEFRERLHLRSCDITILINDYSIKFITRGYGNGLGLSISGATELARSGCSYLQILNYYFSKCKIRKYV